MRWENQNDGRAVDIDSTLQHSVLAHLHTGDPLPRSSSLLLVLLYSYTRRVLTKASDLRTPTCTLTKASDGLKSRFAAYLRHIATKLPFYCVLFFSYQKESTRPSPKGVVRRRRPNSRLNKD
eukprot:1192736-Prorocentrum_minimum.AAC.2